MSKSPFLVSNECGRAWIKAILALTIIGAFVYTGIQLVPIYWDHYNLRESIRGKLEFAFVNHPRDTQRSIEHEIIKLLDSTDVDYTREDVRVQVDRSEKTIHVDIWYTRSHELPFYQNPVEFYIGF
ncbi:MAG: hypothetical protein SWQ30_05540 [Thermodesulfobacteriota bacterium]|nr:hypothetical protein [Thermodesulfobacteriota bacterium]